MFFSQDVKGVSPKPWTPTSSPPVQLAIPNPGYDNLYPTASTYEESSISPLLEKRNTPSDTSSCPGTPSLGIDGTIRVQSFEGPVHRTDFQKHLDLLDAIGQELFERDFKVWMDSWMDRLIDILMADSLHTSFIFTS